MSGWGPPNPPGPPGPPGPQPPPEPRKKRPWPAVALAAVGGVLLTVAFAIVAAFVLALLFWQLMANVVMVIFVQEMRWYGPGVYTAGGDLWWFVFGIGVAGAATFAVGTSMLTRAGAPLRRPGRSRPA